MTSSIFATILVILATGSLSADYPLIRYTRISQDPLYSQQQQDVELWYSGSQEPPLTLFQYMPSPSEDLFSLAAAFNLPYETLATLNGWDTPILFNSVDPVIIPNLPGLFLPENPTNKWEQGMYDNRKSKEGVQVAVSLGGENMRTLVFHRGEKFTSEERIRFLGNIFSSPVHGGVLTSAYGFRVNPFTNHTSFHPGIDIRATIGTPVYTAHDGKVIESGVLGVYGNYIIIEHGGSYQTMYAHLERALVDVGQSVNAGEQVALSGNSGRSTGPHLHFEIRRDGSPIDPLRITALRDE